MSRFRRLGDALIIALAMIMDLIAWAGDRDLRSGPMLPLLIIPAVTLLVYSTLLLRWRHPLGAFGVQWIYAMSSLAIPQFQPFAGMLVALHAVGSRTSNQAAGPALVAMLVPFGVYSYNSADHGSGVMTIDFVRLLALWMMLAAAAWGLGRLSHLSARRAWRLRELQAEEAAEAVTAERLRMARELHDIVASAVTTMMLQASGAKASLDSRERNVHASLEIIEAAGVEAMAELHRMLRVMRAEDIDSDDQIMPPQPTVADISHLVSLAVAAGRDVQLVQDGTPGPLDRSVEVTVYRIVQESLTNSLKHAGAQAAVVVRVHWTRQLLRVSITDRGGGPPQAPDRMSALSSGHGLTGLRERITLSGGIFDARPTADGFEVNAALPRSGVRPLVELDVGRLG